MTVVTISGVNKSLGGGWQEMDDEICAQDSLAARVRAEYHEMPGLSLTAEQASRLFGIELSECRRVLHELVSAGTLYHTDRGAYVAAAPPIRARSSTGR